MINMTIAVDSPRTLKSVFDLYANPETDDYGFSKTHVPLRLAQYGQDDLVSRSQANGYSLGSSGSKKLTSIFPGSNR